MAKHVHANNSLQDSRHFSGKASNSPTHQALSRTSPQICLYLCDRLTFVCPWGSKEEFVQLMKKSLMAEQLYAEGVGPNQKIDDTWIHLGWWLSLFWSHKSKWISDSTGSQNIHQAVLDVLGFSLLFLHWLQTVRISPLRARKTQKICMKPFWFTNRFVAWLWAPWFQNVW